MLAAVDAADDFLLLLQADKDKTSAATPAVAARVLRCKDYSQPV